MAFDLFILVHATNDEENDIIDGTISPMILQTICILFKTSKQHLSCKSTAVQLGDILHLEAHKTQY